MRTRREHCFVFGPFRLEPEEGRLLRDGLLAPLTPKAFAMLLVLVSHSGRLVGKDVLMQELWPDAFVEEGNLTFTMSVLRKALGDSARIARYLETVPKRGYRFIAPVREIDVKNPVKSVAVLPFLNLGSAEGSEAAQEGLHQMKTLASRGYVSPSRARLICWSNRSSGMRPLRRSSYVGQLGRDSHALHHVAEERSEVLFPDVGRL